jgi:transcriptional regulator GlxA family with amidase domain
VPHIFSKSINLLNASNAEKIEALCAWIAENSDSVIGWDDLTKQSGWTHKELIALFNIHKRQSPMSYIRSVREQKKKSSSSHPQPNLFTSFDK